jgi:hypothetical protein
MYAVEVEKSLPARALIRQHPIDAGFCRQSWRRDNQPTDWKSSANVAHEESGRDSHAEAPRFGFEKIG